MSVPQFPRAGWYSSECGVSPVNRTWRPCLVHAIGIDTVTVEGIEGTLFIVSLDRVVFKRPTESKSSLYVVTVVLGEVG